MKKEQFEINEKLKKLIAQIQKDKTKLDKLDYLQLKDLIDYLSKYNNYLKKKKEGE